MNRYQVYLHPQSVSVLDDFESLTNISRSQLIRESIDRLALQLSGLLSVQRKKNKQFLFDILAGYIDTGSNKKTNYADTVDDIYR